MDRLQSPEWPHFYGVQGSDREPLVRFMLEGLEAAGCRIIHQPKPNRAPFVITFETPSGERVGIVAYAFLANDTPIKNRPPDEHRFQIKYGGDLSGLHDVWQDPHGLYTTLLLGINPEQNFFVAADPVLHNPTRFSVSVEFKDEHVEQIRDSGWFTWERERRGGRPSADGKRTAAATGTDSDPLFEVLVGGTRDRMLQLVRHERESLGEAPGERQYIAEKLGRGELVGFTSDWSATPLPSAARLHALAREFDLPESRVLDLISERRMLKMAVRGSVAEEHLVHALGTVEGVESCQKLRDDEGPDVEVVFGGKRLLIECKNSSRVLSGGLPKIDLQRTRASKSDPCSRYYRPGDFDLVAACVHALTERWEFQFAATRELDAHRKCVGRLDNNVKLDSRWTADAAKALRFAARLG